MKRLEKRLDELEIIINEHFKSGKHIPDEIREEYEEATDRYNEMVYVLKEKAVEKFMKEINESAKDY